MAKKFLAAWGDNIPLALLKYDDGRPKFDMVSIWLGEGSSQAQAAQIKALYSTMKVIGYIDIIGDVQFKGYTNFNADSSNYWGYYIVNLLNSFQGFDGVFLDDVHPYYGSGYAPATWTDIYNLVAWLTGKGRGFTTRRVPYVCINDTFENESRYILAPLCDMWWHEAAFTGVWKLVETDIADIVRLSKLTTVCGHPHNRESGMADTQALCQFTYCLFLCTCDDPSSGYFGWNEIWTTDQGSSHGWYAVMDTDHGAPKGAYTRVGNVLTRHFAKYDVTANLDTQTGTLTPVTPPTQHTLTIEATNGGTTNPVPGAYLYPP